MEVGGIIRILASIFKVWHLINASNLFITFPRTQKSSLLCSKTNGNELFNIYSSETHTDADSEHCIRIETKVGYELNMGRDLDYRTRGIHRN